MSVRIKGGNVLSEDVFVVDFGSGAVVTQNGGEASVSGLGGGGSPTGAAGGDLAGSYPNPTLAAAGPGATGPVGSNSTVPVVTIDATGRVTALTSATPTLNALATANATSADVSLNNHKLTNLASPVSGTDAATKAYADSLTGGPANALFNYVNAR